MAGGNAIRGSRIGAGPLGEAERGELVPRRTVEYTCARQHTTPRQFTLEAEVPAEWDCPRCGYPAGTDPLNPPPPPRIEPYKTHLAYVKERRSAEQGEAILAEAVETLRRKRDNGEIF